MPGRWYPALRRLAALTALALPRALPAQVQAPRIREIQIAPPYLRMVPDAQTQVTATAYDTSGMPVNARFRWSSSNINVAVVSENGTVRAIAPGATLITATLEGERGRRRAAQMSVRVSAPAGAPGVVVTPEPGGLPRMPVPPGTPLPTTPPPGPAIVVNPRAMDSAMKASINCNDPMLNSINPLNACYDHRPTTRVSAPAPAVVCPDRGNNSVLLMVKVGEAGEVVEVMPFARSGCDQLVEAAIASARTMSFHPAQRAGQPVAAWLRLVIRPAPVATTVPPAPPATPTVPKP